MWIFNHREGRGPCSQHCSRVSHAWCFLLVHLTDELNENVLQKKWSEHQDNKRVVWEYRNGGMIPEVSCLAILKRNRCSIKCQGVPRRKISRRIQWIQETHKISKNLDDKIGTRWQKPSFLYPKRKKGSNQKFGEKQTLTKKVMLQKWSNIRAKKHLSKWHII